MTYLFKCPKCDKIIEFQLTMEKVSTFSANCKVCGRQLIRHYIPLEVIYKARGFYTTDNREERNGKRGY